MCCVLAGLGPGEQKSQSSSSKKPKNPEMAKIGVMFRDTEVKRKRNRKISERLLPKNREKAKRAGLCEHIS